jgi:hypothetical protein
MKFERISRERQHKRQIECRLDAVDGRGGGIGLKSEGEAGADRVLVSGLLPPLLILGAPRQLSRRQPWRPGHGSEGAPDEATLRGWVSRTAWSALAGVTTRSGSAPATNVATRAWRHPTATAKRAAQRCCLEPVDLHSWHGCAEQFVSARSSKVFNGLARPACTQSEGVMRHTVFDRSSATITAPLGSSVTPTGRPMVLPSAWKPVPKSTGGPLGRPLAKGMKITL